MTSFYRYLVNFLLDSTVGLLLIYILLKVISKVVRFYSITPLTSGEYGEDAAHGSPLGTFYFLFYAGEPFQFHYWLAQCVIYLLVMLIEKVCVGPLILFNFWSKVMYYMTAEL